MDLSHYLLNDFSEYETLKEKYGEALVNDFVDRMHTALASLKPGHMFNITTQPDGTVRPESHLEILVKICCMWIHGNREYELSNDCNRIRRIL